MIAFLSGKLIYKQAPVIILDVNGVGYELLVPMSAYYNLPDLEQKTNLYCYQHVREDNVSLYGFGDLEQRKLFTALLKTNGVGPRLALTILSNFQVREFISIINNGDSLALVKLPGVGKKTAERLLLELRDRLKNLFKNDLVESANCTTGKAVDSCNFNSDSPNYRASDAISALEALGYKYTDAQRVVTKLASNPEHNTSSENLIRAALREFN